MVGLTKEPNQPELRVSYFNIKVVCVMHDVFSLGLIELMEVFVIFCNFEV